MEERKISIDSVLNEGTKIGMKNVVSLIGAVLLWLVTIWIPYVNIGTTIAVKTIPIDLSKGRSISATMIFNKKYRQSMDNYFALSGFMALAILPALCFLLIPGIIISLSWSLAMFIMFDKEVTPTEAIALSKQATHGYKWTIFLIDLCIGLAAIVLLLLTVWIPYLGIAIAVVIIALMLAIKFGCSAVIYRQLAATDCNN